MRKMLLKNKYFVLGVTGILILFVSFLGDYYIYSTIKILNLMDGTYSIINKVSFIGYLYIILSVFVFITTVLNIEQYFKNKNMEKKIYKDELSTLNNRNYLEDILNKKLNGKDYYAIMCDIDHFKNINDTYGHDVGDRVISFVGETLKSSIRNSDDYVIRYGGEEFLILINTTINNYNSNTIYNIFDRIHDKIKNNIFIANNKEFKITMSFGINCFTKNIKTIIENIKLADIALYKAKKERNLIVVYNENNKSNFGLDYSEVFNLLNERKFKIDYIPVRDKDNDLYCYFTKINLKHNEKIYSENMLKDVIFSNEKLLEKWTLNSLRYMLLNDNHQNSEKIFNITFKQLLNENIYNFLLTLFRKDLILNITIEDKEFSLIINRLKSLKKNLKISINDNQNKDILFVLIEEKLIDYLYSKNTNLEYLLFLNKIAKSYNFKLILDNKELNKEKLNKIQSIFTIEHKN